MKDCQGISWQKITDATSAQEGLAKLKCLKKKKNHLANKQSPSRF